MSGPARNEAAGIKSFESLWEGGCFEGDPLNPRRSGGSCLRDPIPRFQKV